MTSWTVARQAPLSMWFPRQEDWSGLPFPSAGDLPYSETALCLLHLQYCQVASLLLHHIINHCYSLNWISSWKFEYKLCINWFSVSVLLLMSLQSCPTLCDPIDGSPPGSIYYPTRVGRSALMTVPLRLFTMWIDNLIIENQMVLSKKRKELIILSKTDNEPLHILLLLSVIG